MFISSPPAGFYLIAPFESREFGSVQYELKTKGFLESRGLGEFMVYYVWGLEDRTFYI